MTDPKRRTTGLILEADDFPPVRGNDLLHNRETKPDAFWPHRDIRFEDVGSFARRNSGAVVADFQDGVTRIDRRPVDVDFSTYADGLNRVEQQIEKRLSEQRRIRHDRE